MLKFVRVGKLFGLVLTTLGCVGCLYDPQDRCSAGEVLAPDGFRCVCGEGFAWTAAGCVACAEDEVPGPSGCACAEGLVRSSPEAACEAVPSALGRACNPSGATCAEAPYDYCHVTTGTAGYCTQRGCVSSGECEAGYACNSAATPSYCERPPRGMGQACASAADCAGTDATWCDTFMTHTCIVQGCSVAAQNCFGGGSCCDLSQFGVPQPLCLPPGAC